MSWRTSLAGIPAGLAFLLSALSQPGPWSWPRALLALGGALLAVLATFAGDHRSQVPQVDPPNPDRVPVGPSLDIFTRVARRELSPEEGARALEAGRERRPVSVVSFEDAMRATGAQQPNARKGEP